VVVEDRIYNGTLYRFMRDIGQNMGLIRIPCVAHVIHLCLTGLLDDLKLRPKNESTERVWTDTQREIIDKSKQGEISGTLAKVNPSV
jgi:hypothetical protein